MIYTHGEICSAPGRKGAQGEAEGSRCLSTVASEYFPRRSVWKHVRLFMDIVFAQRVSYFIHGACCFCLCCYSLVLSHVPHTHSAWLRPCLEQLSLLCGDPSPNFYIWAMSLQGVRCLSGSQRHAILDGSHAYSFSSPALLAESKKVHASGAVPNPSLFPLSCNFRPVFPHSCRHSATYCSCCSNSSSPSAS